MTKIDREAATKIRDLMNKVAGYEMFINQIGLEMSEKQPIFMRDDKGTIHAGITPDDALLVRQAQLDVLTGLRSAANKELGALGVGPDLSPKQKQVKDESQKRKSASDK